MKDKNIVLMAHEMAGMVDNMRAYLVAFKKPMECDVARLMAIKGILGEVSDESDKMVVKYHLASAVKTMCLMILFYVGICHDSAEIIGAMDEYAESIFDT